MCLNLFLLLFVRLLRAFLTPISKEGLPNLGQHCANDKIILVLNHLLADLAVSAVAYNFEQIEVVHFGLKQEVVNGKQAYI